MSPAKNEPRRHHYLPQFYQLGFAEGRDQRLWVYDRLTQRLFRAHPKTICFETDLYTQDPGGSADRRVESRFLSAIDGDAAAAIRQISKPEWSKEDWRQTLSVFMALQVLRTPAFKRVTTEAHRVGVEEVMRIGFSDTNRARGLMETYKHETGEDLGDVTPESMVDAVVFGRLRVVVTERPFLESIAKQLKALSSLFLGRAWTIVEAPRSTGFVTCGYPVVSMPSAGGGQAGPGSPGSRVLFPLSRRFCLYMAKPGDELRFGRCTSEGARAINQNVAIASERFVIGPSSDQLKHVIARSGTGWRDPSPRGTVHVLGMNPDSSVVMLTMWPRRRQVALRP